MICAYRRLGSWFGSERYDIRPDIVTTAKGLSSAYASIGAVIARDAIMEPFLEADAMYAHGMTFGGHPVQCAVALKNLEIMKRERIVEHVAEHKERFRSTLGQLLDLPIAGDLRGVGSSTRSSSSRTRRPVDVHRRRVEWLLREYLSPRLFERGLICRAEDRGEPVIQISPATVAGPEQFDEITGILGDVLADAWAEFRRRASPDRPLVAYLVVLLRHGGGGASSAWPNPALLPDEVAAGLLRPRRPRSTCSGSIAGAELSLVSYYDSFDGSHPDVFVPRERPPRTFESIEEICNYLLAHKEVGDFVRVRGPGGKAVFLMFDEETEELAGELDLDVAFPAASLGHRLDSKIVTTELANEAGMPSVPNAMGQAATYSELLSLAVASGLGTNLVVQTPYGDSGQTTHFVASESDWDDVAHESRATT